MRFFFFLAFLLSASAQTAPPRVGIGITQTKLSLEEAVEMALGNNLEIEIEKTNQTSAHQAVRSARGFLDPVFRWQPLLETRNTPTSSTLASATGKISEHLTAQNFYYRQRLAGHGLFFHADFENTRQSTNNPFVSLTPFTMPRLVAGFTLPLLRDARTDRERTELVVRRKQVDVSDVQFEMKVIDVVARVEQAYYDLVAVRADLEVNGESVALAQDQLERTKRLIASGSLAPVELAAAAAELERRKDNYYSTLALLAQAENALKQLLAGGRQQEIWKDELVPTSGQRTAMPAAAASNLQDLVNQAVGRRVELRALDRRTEINDSQKELARNQIKPQLHLTAAYVSYGLAGNVLETSNPFSGFAQILSERVNALSQQAGLRPLPAISIGGGGPPPEFVGGYAASLGNLFSGRYPTFQGSLTFDWTIRNNTAQANLAQTAIAERRLHLERKQAEQAIEAQVRNALQSIETSEQRIAAAEASARAAKEKLDSEIRLFGTGESTNFLVLTRQNEFSDSRRRVVLATLEFNKSVARLEFALGNTLDQHRIRLR
ncbi:MAG: TolC family protein [Acidobacteria bacterium]|nr:TolC family protein [Acidobacteriota bacterium]